MTCYEKLRKNIEAGKYYKRLENYFRHLDADDLESYHKKRGRGNK